MTEQPDTTPTGSTRGLEEAQETERPWSSAAHDDGGSRRYETKLAHRGETYHVAVSYVAVGGPDGDALQHRQTAALRRALRWLATRPEPATASGAARATSSGAGQADWEA